MHWYGKAEVTRQRKVGHVTITAATPAEARARLAAIDPAAAKSLESTAPAVAATAASPSTATPRVRCIQLRALALRPSPACLTIPAAALPGRRLAPKGPRRKELASGLAGGCHHGIRLRSGDHGGCGTGAFKQSRSQLQLQQIRLRSGGECQQRSASLPVLLRLSQPVITDIRQLCRGRVRVIAPPMAGPAMHLAACKWSGALRRSRQFQHRSQHHSDAMLCRC